MLGGVGKWLYLGGESGVQTDPDRFWIGNEELPAGRLLSASENSSRTPRLLAGPREERRQECVKGGKCTQQAATHKPRKNLIIQHIYILTYISCLPLFFFLLAHYRY